MSRLSIRQKLVASFVLVILAVCVMGGFAYVGFINVAGKASDLEAHALQALQYNWQTSAKWEDNYLLTQKLVIQPDQASFDKLKQQLLANRAAFNTLISEYEGILSSGLAQQLFPSLKAVRIPYQGVQDEIIKAGIHLREDPGRSQAIMRLLASHFGMVNNAVNALTQASTKVAEVSIKAMIVSLNSAQIGMAASFVAALTLAFLCGFYLMRAITRPLGVLTNVMDRMRQGDFTQRLDRRDEFGALGHGLNRMADDLAALFSQVQTSGIQVDNSVTQIAATAKQQEATASEMAATTTEIGATSKEISATSKELATTMNHVSSVAEQTAALANAGQAGLSRMDEIMMQVMEASSSIHAKLAVLNEEAARITQVVATITKIADQTNLLSLNAAIEAEKAGEYGRGFAVVASEIRRLADQTAISTYDIEQMVSKIQSAVAAGVTGMDKFSEEVRRGMDEERRVSSQLSEIIQQVQALPPRIENATDGMRVQVTGAEQITEALLQLTQAAQQSLDSLRQSTHAIEELNKVSGNLKSGVSRFKLAAAPLQGGPDEPRKPAAGLAVLRRWIALRRARTPIEDQHALQNVS